MSLGWFSCMCSILVELEFGDVGFHRGRKNWRTRRKTLGARMRTMNKLNPHMSPGRNRTQATGQGGERHRNCTIPVPQTNYLQSILKIQKVAICIISAWLVS